MAGRTASDGGNRNGGAPPRRGVTGSFHPPAYFNAAQSIAASADVWMSGFASAEALHRSAERRLHDMVRFARNHSAFYRELYRDLPKEIGSLRDLPVVDKSTLMASFDGCVTDAAVTSTVAAQFTQDESLIGHPLLGRYAVWTSSGTSGHPGMFLHDGQALAVYDALELIRFRRMTPPAPMAGGLLPGDRYAVVSANGGHFLSNSTVNRVQQLYPWLAARIRLFSIMAATPTLTRELDDFRPTWLATYPTAAIMLAAEQAAGRLSIAPREIRVGGEQFTHAERDRVEAAFGCPVRNDYGCSEFPPITWECAHRGMHVNSDWVTLEPVDEAMQPVPAGQPSHSVLLTNLVNRIQPLIRYDLGDSITWLTEPCACGSPFPTIRVAGRCDDLVTLSGASGHTVSLLPLALTTVLEEHAGLFHFQLFRPDAGRLSLRLDPDRTDVAAGQRACDALQRFLHAHGTGDVQIDVELRAFEPCGASGKLKRIFAHGSAVA